MGFTEEQAKEKLEDLGFEVVEATKPVGYGVEFRPEFGNWALIELHRSNGRWTTMTLEVFDDPISAAWRVYEKFEEGE